MKILSVILRYMYCMCTDSSGSTESVTKDNFSEIKQENLADMEHQVFQPADVCCVIYVTYYIC